MSVSATLRQRRLRLLPLALLVSVSLRAQDTASPQEPIEEYVIKMSVGGRHRAKLALPEPRTLRPIPVVKVAAAPGTAR